MNTMKFKFYGEEYNLFLEVSNYANNGNIAIEIWDEKEGPFADLTVNICDLPEGLAAIDVNNFKEGIDLIKEYNLGEFTNNFITSGYCTYPIYALNMDNINKYKKGGVNNMDELFKESLDALEKTLDTLPKYQRKSCQNCEYKLICAGECEKTIEKEVK